MANPTVYIDPDGREVRVLDKQSLEMIKNTLPVDLQGAVKVGDDNLLRKDVLNAVETGDPNFLALRELANRSEVTAVQSSDRVRFINTEGAIVEEPFTFQTREQVIKEMAEQGVPREQLENEIPEGKDFLFLGMLATPRDSDSEFDNQATVSLTGEATVTLPSEEVDAPEVEKSKTAAHEIFGHALLFQQGEKFEHGDVSDNVFREIEERTEQNFNSNNTTVGENPDEPGVVLKEGGGHENRR